MVQSSDGIRRSVGREQQPAGAGVRKGEHAAKEGERAVVSADLERVVKRLDELERQATLLEERARLAEREAELRDRIETARKRIRAVQARGVLNLPDAGALSSLWSRLPGPLKLFGTMGLLVVVLLLISLAIKSCAG